MATIFKPHKDITRIKHSFDKNGKEITEQVTLSPVFEMINSDGNSIVNTVEGFKTIGINVPTELLKTQDKVVYPDHDEEELDKKGK